MADPLSITVSVVTLIKVSVQAGILLKQFSDDVGGINATLSGLLNDVEGFQQVLESMKETLDQDEIKASLTGFVGNHWRNIARSLQNGEETLQKLTDLLESVNKKSSFLDGPRKVFRFKSAIEQIALYRERIQSCRDALQVSLSAIIFSNQVMFQRANERIPERIISNLDKIFEEIRIVDSKIGQFQHQAVERKDEDGHHLALFKNLRECVRSAADVVSTASSTLTVDVTSNDNGSVRYGSDFGDVFENTPNEMMQRWMSSNTIYEDEPLPTSNQAGTSHRSGDEYSDSESDIENEMIKALFDHAKRLKEEGDLVNAERKFRNCLSLSSTKSTSADGITKSQILEVLIDICCLTKSWEKAKAAVVEKMAITERQVGKKDATYIWDTLTLADILLNNKDYVEAHLQGRRALQGFKRLKEPGLKGYEACLGFLVELCKDQGRNDEEDAYAALLERHQAMQKSLSKSAEHSTAFTSDVANPPTTTPNAIGVADTLPEDSHGAPVKSAEQVNQVLFPEIKLEQPMDTGHVSRKTKRNDKPLDTSTKYKPRTMFGTSAWYMLYETAATREKFSLELDLLNKYGEEFHDRKPSFSAYHDTTGWNCLVLFNATKSSLVSGYETENMAKEAAISQACQDFIPEQIERLRANGGKMHDPYSEKEVYVPETENPHLKTLDQPDLVVSVDFGLIDTGVAYSTISATSDPRIRTICRWSGRNLANEHRVPSVLAYNKNASEVAWGFLAETMLENDSTASRKEFFKILLDEQLLEQIRKGSNNPAELPSTKVVQEWYHDYFQGLYSCIERRLKTELAMPWADANIEFTCSIPVGWRNRPVAETFREIIHSAGFGSLPNHKVVVDLAEPEVLIMTVGRKLHLVYEENEVQIACDIMNGVVELSAWRRVKNANPSVGRMRLQHVADSGLRATVYVDNLFQNIVVKRLQSADIASPLGVGDLNLAAFTMSTSREYQNAKDDYGSEESITDTGYWSVRIPGLENSYKNSESGIRDGEMFFKRTEIEHYLDVMIKKLILQIDALLEQLERQSPQLQVAHLIIYGNIDAPDYTLRCLRAHYNSNMPSWSTKSLKVLLAPEQKLAICKGLVEERLLRHAWFLSSDNGALPSWLLSTVRSHADVGLLPFDWLTSEPYEHLGGNHMEQKISSKEERQLMMKNTPA